MKDGSTDPDLTIFTGRFGSGKTEVALNYAQSLVHRPEPEPRQTPSSEILPLSLVILIDLDIVTPYFRSREMADRMKERGVDVIAPSAIGLHLDTPAITPQILGAIQQLERPVVLDVGGDKQGARALGQFSAAIQQRGYRMHFVVNPYRPFTGTLEGLANSITEIEASARLKVTSLVSNPNLIGETAIEHILKGHAKIKSFAQALGLPIAFICMERRWIQALDTYKLEYPVLALSRHFVMSWE
jgi:hypothetical protein